MQTISKKNNKQTNKKKKKKKKKKKTLSYKFCWWNIAQKKFESFQPCSPR